ncbi:MAG: winged helix DNA-binding protein [Bacteroidales bacterium]|jgi:DNA-binding MarR family transcriptional regulator|nr:winged helix DNA-binding protein [Bacteroidales bacterium]MDD3273625.1 winged helix DNA-binding protein [Bacteroidales bacterium]MDD4057365.1 winged helix DNA-binding protein [Bacteroidales bacterium]
MEEICKIKDLYRTLYIFEREFQNKNEITINEAMLLCSLKDESPKSAHEICEFIGLSSSRGSRIINTTEQKGYIKREMGKEDKRQMIFTLTSSGKSKIAEMSNKSLEIGLDLQNMLK